MPEEPVQLNEALAVPAYLPSGQSGKSRRRQRLLVVEGAVLVLLGLCGACSAPNHGTSMAPVERPALNPERQARRDKLLASFPNRLDAAGRVDQGNPVIWELAKCFSQEAATRVIVKLESGDAASRAYAAHFLRLAPSDDAVPALIKALDDGSPLVAKLAHAALAEYYFEPEEYLSGFVHGPEPLSPQERTRNAEDARQWSLKYKGQTRRQILLTVLKDERDVHALSSVPKVLPRDEAIDYLVAWALSDRKTRIWGMHNLRHMTGLDAFGRGDPNERSIDSARSFWKWVGSLSPGDRTILIAIGRLLTRKDYAYPICDRMSEGEARKAFLADEKRSLRLWRRLYEWEDVCGQSPKEGSGQSRQYGYLKALARINSPECLAIVKRARDEHRSEWLGDAMANLLHNLEVYPGVVMEEPVPGTPPKAE